MAQEAPHQEKAEKKPDRQMKAAFYGAMAGVCFPLASVAPQPFAGIAALAFLYSFLSASTQTGEAMIHSDGHAIRDGVKTFATGFGSYVLALALSTAAFEPADNADTAKIDDKPAVTQQMETPAQSGTPPAMQVR